MFPVQKTPVAPILRGTTSPIANWPTKSLDGDTAPTKFSSFRSAKPHSQKPSRRNVMFADTIEDALDTKETEPGEVDQRNSFAAVDGSRQIRTEGNQAVRFALIRSCSNIEERLPFSASIGYSVPPSQISESETDKKDGRTQRGRRADAVRTKGKRSQTPFNNRIVNVYTSDGGNESEEGIDENYDSCVDGAILLDSGTKVRARPMCVLGQNSNTNVALPIGGESTFVSDEDAGVHGDDERSPKVHFESKLVSGDGLQSLAKSEFECEQISANGPRNDLKGMNPNLRGRKSKAVRGSQKRSQTPFVRRKVDIYLVESDSEESEQDTPDTRTVVSTRSVRFASGEQTNGLGMVTPASDSVSEQSGLIVRARGRSEGVRSKPGKRRQTPFIRRKMCMSSSESESEDATSDEKSSPNLSVEYRIPKESFTIVKKGLSGERNESILIQKKLSSFSPVVRRNVGTQTFGEGLDKASSEVEVSPHETCSACGQNVPALL